MKLNLSSYDNSWYFPGNKIKIFIWIFISFFVFTNKLPIPSWFKVFLLRAFGARIGSNVVIKPGCKIKYPWNLFISDNVWLGEDCWIDNLSKVIIENDCCISQGAYIFTGNHNYKKSTFDLMLNPITLKAGCWVGAKSVVCPNVIIGECSILTAGSVATTSLQPYSIYQGNPAIFKRKREFQI